ncbi:hypothetical protein C3578_26880, partial [Salmonella enterica]|nr:hypothetical protein [Salmonella enterica]
DFVRITSVPEQTLFELWSIHIKHTRDIKGGSIQCGNGSANEWIEAARFKLHPKHTSFSTDEIREFLTRWTEEKGISPLYHQIDTGIWNHMLRIRIMPGKIPGDDPEMFHQ